jgi:hypothetical protein
MHKHGYLNVIGFIANSKNIYSVAAARSIFDNYYGIKTITYGAYKGSTNHSNGSFDGDSSVYTQQLVTRFRPGDSASNYMDATTAQRTILHNSPDGSVVIVDGGFMSTTADLLASPGDSIDSRNGVDLVAAKLDPTKGMIWVAGILLTGTDVFNVALATIPQAQFVLANWPVTIPFTWLDVGGSTSGFAAANMFTGPPTTAGLENTNPVRYAAVLSPTQVNGQGQRNAWAQPAFLYAAFGTTVGDWGIAYGGQHGQVTLDGAGVTTWNASPDHNHRYLTTARDLSYYFNQWLAESP